MALTSVSVHNTEQKDELKFQDMSLNNDQEQTLIQVMKRPNTQISQSWWKRTRYIGIVTLLAVIVMSGIFILSVLQPQGDKQEENLQIKSYSERDSKSSVTLGHINFYIHKSNRDSHRRLSELTRLPVARFDRRHFHLSHKFRLVKPWSTVYVDRYTQQTLFTSPKGQIYLLPPIINADDESFSIAELLLSKYISLANNDLPRRGSFDLTPYFKPIPLIGPDIPKFNFIKNSFMHGVYTNYESKSREESDNDEDYHQSRSHYSKTTATKPNDKKRLDCQVVILGAGMSGAHSAYRLSPIYKNKLCIFERENRVGGRAYDLDYNGNVPEAYSTTPISPLGCVRFYKGQSVIKDLIEELNITYYPYDYQTQLIKTRGKLYTSYNEMCLQSYVNLTCTDDSQGNSPPDQLWLKLLDKFDKNPKDLYKYADVNALCRALFGDEATEYLKDSFRFRADFYTDVYSYLEYLKQEWNLLGTIYYPYNGLSQIVKRMIYQSTKIYQARLYLNEEVIRIDEKDQSQFLIETRNYKISCKQLVISIPPTGWLNIQGTIANDIKLNKHFQSILPVNVVVINNYWSERWWEKTSLSNKIIDRVWTRQNCISFMEILSQHPEKMEQNITRTVYDDGLCTDVWSTLINRSSNNDLIDELLRGLQSIYTDISIPKPKKIQTQIWHGAWHLQKPNSHVTNKDILQWALKPLDRFNKNQISLVGEAYNIDRSGWSDGAIKSSLMSLYSQFNFKKSCFQDDQAVQGEYCSDMFI